MNRELFFVPGSEKCLDKKEKAAKEVPIKLVDLTSAFLILGIGLGLATLCFLIEIIVAKYQKEMKLRKFHVADVTVIKVEPRAKTVIPKPAEKVARLKPKFKSAPPKLAKK